MTLGPTIAVLPLFDRARGWLAKVLITFGRVPFFYYLLHIPAIHLAAIVVTLVRGEGVHPEWYATAPYAHDMPMQPSPMAPTSGPPGHFCRASTRTVA